MSFKVGDIVKHKGSYLRSIAWYTNVPKNGKVESLSPIPDCVNVRWCNDPDVPEWAAPPINIANIMLDSESDYS